MKPIVLTVFLVSFFFIDDAAAQSTLSGRVISEGNEGGLAGATVKITNTYIAVSTDSDGRFTLGNVTESTVSLTISYIGYRDTTILIEESKYSDLIITLNKETYLTGTVTISSTRLPVGSPMSFIDISKEEIERINTGRDIPYLLEQTPSVVSTSDAGTGIGYTGIRIRGSDPTRINVTINGIPINDAESQGMYWVDLPDLASSVEDIQVQRGVGTSTNGAGAFGGSINIRTTDPGNEAYGSVGTSFGSFNTLMNNIKAGTGLLSNNWKFETRLSRLESDGYIDRSSADLKSAYFSGGYYGEKDILKAVVLTGKEITYQSWYGVPEAALDTNRTWNYYTYDNQVDDYQQDHYQLFYTRKLNEYFSINSALHYTYGRGFFEEYQESQDLADYGVSYPVIGVDTVVYSDLIRRKWLDNDFYGAVLSAEFNGDRSDLIGGISINEYDGDHFGEIIWAEYSSTMQKDQKYYDYNGLKTEFNAFAKWTYRLNDAIRLFADLQVRSISYEFTGVDDEGSPAPGNEDLSFFNPKAGITWHINDQNSAYLSAAVANKEPSSIDYTESVESDRPKHENLLDIEAGLRHTTQKLNAGFNLYFMDYNDQLVLTGEVNDVGNYIRTNIEKSYRTGIEIDAAYKLNPWITIAGNLTLSENKIKSFTEYTDNYDTGIQQKNEYTDTDLSFSPSIISFAELRYLPLKNLELAINSKFVGKQYLDNTSDENKAIDPYSLTGFVLNYRVPLKFLKELHITLMVNNVFDREYESNGYTFSYIWGGTLYSENYYYPQAGVNYLTKLTLNF